jgi:hypothetical protein
MEGAFMTYVEIHYRNFNNEELRKLIKMHINIVYPVPDENCVPPNRNQE